MRSTVAANRARSGPAHASSHSPERLRVSATNGTSSSIGVRVR